MDITTFKKGKYTSKPFLQSVKDICNDPAASI